VAALDELKIPKAIRPVTHQVAAFQRRCDPHNPAAVLATVTDPR
jgi:hypothetical protein